MSDFSPEVQKAAEGFPDLQSQAGRKTA